MNDPLYSRFLGDMGMSEDAGKPYPAITETPNPGLSTDLETLRKLATNCTYLTCAAMARTRGYLAPSPEVKAAMLKFADYLDTCVDNTDRILKEGM